MRYLHREESRVFQPGYNDLTAWQTMDVTDERVLRVRNSNCDLIRVFPQRDERKNKVSNFERRKHSKQRQQLSTFCDNLSKPTTFSG